MPRDESQDEFVRYLADSLDVTSGVARRVIDDVLAHHAETLEAFVLRRHEELRQPGHLRNDAIFAAISEEAARRPFCVAAPSPRKIRRIIYG